MTDRIVSRIVIEVLGSPKGHVGETMKKVIGLLKDESGLKLLKETTYETEQVDKLWSTFSDLEIETEGIDRLMEISFKYFPSSIEILEPSSLKMEAKNLSAIFNDVMAKIHDYDLAVKRLNAELLLRNKRSLSK